MTGLGHWIWNGEGIEMMVDKVCSNKWFFFNKFSHEPHYNYRYFKVIGIYKFKHQKKSVGLANFYWSSLLLDRVDKLEAISN